MAPRLILLVGAILLAGCRAPGATVGTQEPNAVDVAKRRAQLDLMCAEVTTSVLDQGRASSLRPANGGTTFEYSIAAAGCGQQKTYRVVCPAVGSACFVAQDGAR